MIDTKTLKIGDRFSAPLTFTVVKNDPNDDIIMGKWSDGTIFGLKRDKVLDADYNIGVGDHVRAENGKHAIVKAANGDDLWLQYDDETYGTSHKSHLTRA